MELLSKFYSWAAIWCFLLNLAFARIMVDNTYQTCAKHNLNAATMLTATRTLATTAIQEMDNSAGWMNTDTWSFYKVWALFDTYFDMASTDMAARWNTVRDNLVTLQGVSENSPENIYIMCDDDDPVITTPPTGVKVFHNPVAQIDEDLIPSFVSCKEVSAGRAVRAYRFQTNASPGVTFLVLCLKQHPDLVTNANAQHGPGQYLGDKQTYYTSLFHEFSHVFIPSMRGSRDLPNQPNTAEMWGLIGCQMVRSTYAVENPDSLTFFALGLDLSSANLNDLLWDSGMSQTRKERYQELMSNNQQAFIQRFNLPQPP